LARGDFWDFIEKTLVGKRGATVFLCTHDLEEAKRLADQVIILDRGRVIEKGRPSELRELIGGDSELEMRYTGPIPTAWLRKHGDSVSIRDHGCMRLILDPAGMGQEELIRSFVLEGGTLLEVFRPQDDLLELLNRRIRPDA
jgi:ABC-2 type transport system ATP-binding protein